eukprot:5159273-Prymnesium_polylepis.1
MFCHKYSPKRAWGAARCQQPKKRVTTHNESPACMRRTAISATSHDDVNVHTSLAHVPNTRRTSRPPTCTTSSRTRW